MGLEPTNLRLEALRGNHYSSDDCYLLKQMFNFLKCMLHEATYINRWRSRFCSFLIQIFEFWGCRNLSNISKCKKKSIWNKISERKYLLRWGSNPRKWDKTWRNLCPSKPECQENVLSFGCDVRHWNEFPKGPSINDVGPFFRIYDPPPSPCRLRLLNRLM